MKLALDPRQILALVIGLVAGVGVVLYHWPRPPLRVTSSQTQASGGIVHTYESPKSVWPPVAFAAVVAATGLAVYGLRRRPE